MYVVGHDVYSIDGLEGFEGCVSCLDFSYEYPDEELAVACGGVEVGFVLCPEFFGELVEHFVDEPIGGEDFGGLSLAVFASLFGDLDHFGFLFAFLVVLVLVVLVWIWMGLILFSI